MDALKNVINLMFAPQPLIIISCIAFAAIFYYLEAFAKVRSLILMIGGIIGFFALSALDDNFRVVLTKPDNIPIIIIFLALPFVFWLWAHQAVDNDKRIAEGRPPREIDCEPKVVYVWPHLVYPELICIVLMKDSAQWIQPAGATPPAILAR